MENVCAIAADTKGPEIRTGKLAADVTLAAGQDLVLTVDPALSDCGTAETVFVDYPTLPADLSAGPWILADNLRRRDRR